MLHKNRSSGPDSRYSFAARLGLELVIVFAGVYLAFLFNEYTSNREVQERKIQLLEGLNNEIDYFLGGARRRQPDMKAGLEQWQEKLLQGEKQVPLYFTMRGRALPTRSMWQVVLYFDGIDLLDVQTMFELSKYYNAFDIMLEKYDKLICFAEDEIIPYENNPGFFYGSNGALLPKYEAYIERYSDFIVLFDVMIEDSEALIERLKIEINRL